MKYHIFRGKRYRILWPPWAKLWDGGIDWKAKCIKIAGNQNEKGRLDTLIHESLHACYPDLKESAVSDGAESIADFLWRDGWRRE